MCIIKSILKPAGIDTCGSHHSLTSMWLGYFASIQVRISAQSAFIAFLSLSPFTSDAAMSTLKPSTPLSIQNAMMLRNSLRTACGPGASHDCSHG